MTHKEALGGWRTSRRQGSRNSGSCCLLLGLEMGRFGMRVVNMLVRYEPRKTDSREILLGGTPTLYSCHFLEETNLEADLMNL